MKAGIGQLAAASLAAIFFAMSAAHGQSPPPQNTSPQSSFPQDTSQQSAVSDSARTDHVRASLVGEARAVRAGEKLLVALHLEIIPRWHVYWTNPGDSGLPPQIDWSLPPGVRAGPIQWPVPHAIKIGPLVNYGYEKDVWLLNEIAVPADAAIGQTLRLGAQVKWLVCEEICIPEQAELVLTLDVAAAATPDPAQRENFTAARRALPVASPWDARVTVEGDKLALRVGLPQDMASRITDAYFFAATPDAVAHAASQSWNARGDGLQLTLAAGAVPIKPGTDLPGVLLVKETGGQQLAFAVDAKGSIRAGEPSGGPSLSLALALLYALLGGLILNLMPCVFPVLSMKALALLNSAGHERAQARVHSLVYVVGLLVGFAVVGGVLLAVRAGGESVGWGFQLQAPWFVAGLAALMLAVGLNLSGVFEFAALTIGQQRAGRGGISGSFLTGLLAVAVATPCTAPFMAAALGFALAQPPAASLAIFVALGLGMGLPWLLVALVPGVLRALPRPGPWMEWLRRVLAFLMYGTAAWLVWVLAQQGDAISLAWAMAALVSLGFAAWLFGATRAGTNRARSVGAVVALLSLASALAAVAMVGQGLASTDKRAGTMSERQSGEKFSEERLAALRAAGTPVLVNMTAAWCITCLVNERVTLSDSAVMGRIKQQGVVYLKGDWTRQDPEITRYLAQFGRSGVPLYVLYDKAGMPRILPQILLPADIIQSLDSL